MQDLHSCQADRRFKEGVITLKVSKRASTYLGYCPKLPKVNLCKQNPWECALQRFPSRNSLACGGCFVHLLLRSMHARAILCLFLRFVFLLTAACTTSRLLNLCRRTNIVPCEWQLISAHVYFDCEYVSSHLWHMTEIYCHINRPYNNGT